MSRDKRPQVLFLLLAPPPHVELHVDHSDQVPQPLHAPSVQSSLSSASPTQPSMEYRATPGTAHLLLLSFDPGPQEAEHCDQGDQGVHSGQVPFLQALSSVASPSHAPSTLQVRFRLSTPSPHDLLHSAHSPHSDHSAQISVLHVSNSSMGPKHWHVHTSSPSASQCRSRLLTPPPQLTLHSLQSDHWEKSGQPLVLHSSLSSVSPSHPYPPSLVTLRHCLPRDLLPPPQVSVHEVHSPQGVQ